MIVKILSRGKSFKGLGTYLTHDPKAETDGRVGWTHTLNLAHDHVSSAIDEMIWTARNAELLKQEAGIRAGGRATENAVKHVSLNWAPDDRPTREHMIEAAEGFLDHMGWREHQALLVAHEEKAHAHVHIMLNVVHPETGLRLDDGFEQRRAQAWALEYERERGRIDCPQRLLDAEAREDAPTRPAWLAFQQRQQEFKRGEKVRQAQEPILIRDLEIAENPADAEWKMLKKMQREERQAFFVEGKMAFSELRTSIYREVREEFREKWADYFVARDAGNGDPEALAERKAALVAEQKSTLEERRDAACDELLATRKCDYQDLLDAQQEARIGLRWRQEAGLDSAIYFDVATANDRKAVEENFRDSANETTLPQMSKESEAREMGGDRPAHRKAGIKSETAIGASVGIGFGLGLVDILGGIADGLVWSKPDPKPRPRQDEDGRRTDPFEAVIDEARQRQAREQEAADREWRQKQRGAGE